MRQTGDRVIILDKENDPFVIMDLNNYRSLLREEVKVANISEEELLDKINRQISAWKSSQPDLSDYDLAQFRVDSLRKEPVTIGQPEPTVDSLDDNIPGHDELLSRVIDNGDSVGDDDVYYPEPEI